MFQNKYNAKAALTTKAGTVTVYKLDALKEAGIGHVDRLPYSIKVLLEACLRNFDDYIVTDEHIQKLAGYDARNVTEDEIPFTPGRVVLQDFTGVPAVVDLAALRSAMERMEGDVNKVNPLIRADLVIDHSIQVDAYGSAAAIGVNRDYEFDRNKERYEFLKWGQGSFDNFSVVPPETGIVHQVNLEYLAGVVLTAERDGETLALPDSLVGTDSHTTMINGLGVLGWGVGGIEAEAAMLGQPIYMLIPEVVGFELKGAMLEGATATDLVLTVTQQLRKHGVVGKFVEFFGAGLDSLSLADRATIANMAPEYGATMGFFPVDQKTLDYMELTGRSPELIDLVEQYCKLQGLWRSDRHEIVYTSTLSLDLDEVQPSLAGPKRPQDRILMSEMKPGWQQFYESSTQSRAPRSETTHYKDQTFELHDAAVVIAAITSCTNTSNPDVMIGAGLVAQKANALGLKAKPWVKTSLAPGSRVVSDYLDRAGLTEHLEAIGFYTVGYGCTTCIAEGTPVLQAHGTSRPIERLAAAGGAVLLSPAAEGEAHLTTHRETMQQGERHCVQLTLQDGRELVCTPDHKLLTVDGRWVRADALDLDTDRLVIGLEAPLDEIDRREEIFVLRAGDRVFEMKTEQGRLHTLAFARLLGHLLGDGSISTTGQARMHVGQAMDRELVLNDVEMLTGKRPVGNAYDERKWTIVLPVELSRAIMALEGVTIGRQIDQAAIHPAFVLDDLCPVSVVREYLGGVFGADGHSPMLHRYDEEQESSSLIQPIYSQTARAEHVEALKDAMTKLTWLLGRCGVTTTGHIISEYPVRRAQSSWAAADGEDRVEVRLQLPDGLSFMQKVGYRYCVEKALRGSAATAYWRMISRIGEQRLWMADRMRAMQQEQPELSFARARELAAAELGEREAIVFEHYSLLAGLDRFGRLPTAEDRVFRPLHRNSCEFPSALAFLGQSGAREWFSALDRHEDADYSKSYCTDKNAMSLPTMSLGILDRRDLGTRRVFDVAVDTHESFFANGIAVHNCIGNSGPLPEPIEQSIKQGSLYVASVLSGNRNFEGRISPLTQGNYLASPPLVVAYALAGTVDIDLHKDPIAQTPDGKDVYLKDLWPSNEEIRAARGHAVTREQFTSRYASVYEGPEEWRTLPTSTGAVYTWAEESTYIQEPPFFTTMGREVTPIQSIQGARCLVNVGDSITTDHISPAGVIPPDSPAADYLRANGVALEDFNSFGSRRGNDRVMTRGTFANVRLKNQLAPGTEGGYTTYFGPGEAPATRPAWLTYQSDKSPESGEQCFIYDAAVKYQEHGIPLVILAGNDYGMGSSRDWAAKGTYLLGVKAVIAKSYERIHRSNLVGMGVLPLQFKAGQGADTLNLNGEETFSIAVGDDVKPLQELSVTATAPDGTTTTFDVVCRIDTPVEVDYYRNGGILHTVLRKMLG